MFQEALQLYDTPRNVREAIEAAHAQTEASLGGFTGPMGNYDTPAAGALPVFRKPCGCVLKLTSDGHPEETPGGPETVLTWAGVREDTPDGRGMAEADHESELRIPRVRLTGQGRMPVVDMSKINASRCLSEPPASPRDVTCHEPHVTRGSGLPPPHPTSPQHALYAQVNKARKTKALASPDSQQGHTNYTNLEFVASLPLYENSRDVLSRVASLPPHNGGQRSEAPPPPEPLPGGHNYLNMSPKRRANYELMSRSHQTGHQASPGPPGSEEAGLYPLCESVESMVLMGDSRFNTIKQMPKPSAQAVTIDMAASYHGDALTSEGGGESVVSSGYVTMPRQQGRPPGQANYHLVTMRRSASVPCKRPDRDSTSSGGSDSGVSTGSPRQSITDQMEFIK